jgi:hypothetical protein
VFAVHRRSHGHEPARQWLEERFNGSERVGLPWGSLLAFVRLCSHPAVVGQPLPFRRSMGLVREWLTLPPVWIPQPTQRHAEVVASLLDGESKHDLVPDAHLAALAIEHGLTLCSTDRDFARFEGLRWTDPLRSAPGGPSA